jgi:hypothetical protein
MNVQKTIKLPLFLLIEPNGILWILVCKLVRKPFPFTTISEDDYEYILNHSGVYCFVSDAEILRKINLIRDKIPNVKEVYSFNEIEAVKNWNDLLIQGVDTGNQSVEDRKTMCNQRFGHYHIYFWQEDQRE